MATTHRACATIFGGLLLIGVTACGGGGADRDEFVDQMVEDGTFTEDQANCIADEMESRVDFEGMADPDYEPTPEDVEAITAATGACLSAG